MCTHFQLSRRIVERKTNKKERKIIIPENPIQQDMSNDDVHYVHLNDYGKGVDRISQLRKKSGDQIGKKPTREIQYRDKGDSKHSMIIIRTENNTKVLQIAWWRDGTLKHLDCKTCNNNWYLADTIDYSDKFEVDGNKIKCKLCGT